MPQWFNVSIKLFLLYKFRVNLNFHIIADGSLAGAEQLVVEEIEIFSVDRRHRGNSAARITPWVGDCRSRAVDVQRDLVRSTVDGQIADHLQFAAAAGDPLGLEFHGGILFHVKEIRAAQIFVAHLNPGIDRVDIDGGRHLRLRNIFFVQHDAPRHLGKTASYIRNPEVTNGKLGGRVRGVNIPGGSLGQRRQTREQSDGENYSGSLRGSWQNDSWHQSLMSFVVFFRKRESSPRLETNLPRGFQE